MSARIEDAGDRLIIWNGNTAKRGALSPELYEAINQAMEQAQEPRIRSVILTSEGGFFCAGGNLNVLIERRQLSETQRRGKVDELHDLLRGIRACPVPVIAAVEGGAAGAGLSLALACDLIVAAKDAKFTAAYVKAGLVPDGGLTSAMARLLPRPLAMEMCLMGRPVMATRFAELGAVNRLAAPGKVMEEAMVLADHLAAGSRVAQGVIRGLVAQAYETSEADQLDAERDAMAAAAGRDEAAEGIAAFLEKRPAVY
ncbi:oxepin-CoA hydrolase, alternative type [Sulfitobacter pacificus]|uniref:Enoyl-CoA hydratase n=1 Tax=Sulfitobacter pacificus TaxID=1499314 RepID=A0ABQ5VEI9_9RHOB|nr:enoyl-CoA hydratase family protein [Sulfitobacter pacificus]GLQ25494.1 enoyl-CoA hydratase [Sulfitobacter pacificus]